MERKLSSAKQWKGMLFGCEQPFLWGVRCVTSQKTAAKETSRASERKFVYPVNFLHKYLVFLKPLIDKLINLSEILYTDHNLLT